MEMVRKDEVDGRTGLSWALPCSPRHVCNCINVALGSEYGHELDIHESMITGVIVVTGPTVDIDSGLVFIAPVSVDITVRDHAVKNVAMTSFILHDQLHE